MKITPQNTSDIFKDPFRDLTPTDKNTRKAAILIAFAGVFFWAVKILFI